MSTLLILAVGSYLFLAVRMFNDDKSAYVFEGNATLVGTIAAEVASTFKNIEKTMDLMAAAVSRDRLSDLQSSLTTLFNGDDELVSAAVFKLSEYPQSPLWIGLNEEFSKPYGLKLKDYAQLRDKIPFTTSSLVDKPHQVMLIHTDSGVPLLAYARASNQSTGPVVVLSFLRQDRRIKLFSRSEIFTTYMANAYGQLLVHPDANRLKSAKSLQGDSVFKDIMAAKFDTGVKELSRAEEDIIVGFSKTTNLGLYVISEITRKKAFIASQRLVEKSILFALLIIGLSLIVSIVFAKKITSSLIVLYQATQEIMRGNFLVKVNVTSRDEVGALSLGFNTMAGEISRLMQETADKARMEKELETAQLVQDNFFPIQEMQAGEYDLAAFYKPASECGGDWWGQFTIGRQLIVLIGDATGHGVPSALITAAAQSCVSTLSSIARDFPDMKLSPAMILEKMNYSIFRASRGTVKMTFFCGILDLDTGRMRSANASHEMPFLCKANPKGPLEPRSKKDVVVCQGKSGLILGHVESTSYEEHEFFIGPGELLLMYTDGLVECKNSSEEMYGKGRLLRFIYKNALKSASQFRSELIEEALAFFGNRERDDDVTLVILKRRAPGESAA